MSAARQLTLVGYTDHIEEAAIERDRLRPDVYAEFARSALDAKRAGALMGAKAIAEHIRFSRCVERGERDFLINNSDVSCWARWAERDHEELTGYFRKRVRTAK